MLAAAGFHQARSCRLKGDPEYLSVAGYARWIEAQPLSTFFLLSGDEPAAGLEKLRRAPRREKIRQFFV